jgi:hypothetical protein
MPINKQFNSTSNQIKSTNQIRSNFRSKPSQQIHLFPLASSTTTQKQNSSPSSPVSKKPKELKKG